MNLFGEGRAASAEDYRRLLEGNSRAAAKLAAATARRPSRAPAEPGAEYRARRPSGSAGRAHLAAGGDRPQNRAPGRCDAAGGGTLALLLADPRRARRSAGRPGDRVDASLSCAPCLRRARARLSSHGAGDEAAASHRRRSVTQARPYPPSYPGSGPPHRPRRSTLKRM
ncbi:protein V57 [Equid herpesvirus 6]|uniref:Protein V57 n=1 Tax=Equid herpesvirus 6 TaxID=173566 RepID=A0A7S9YXI3_9ALPH|nr:protein V57 [Equid herpesvirus 6]QPI70172.1 protein V57 [Equid herpesvirus 6]